VRGEEQHVSLGVDHRPALPALRLLGVWLRKEGLAADGRALALVAKCERISDFSVLASAAAIAQHQEHTSTICDLSGASWEQCTNATQQGHLLPGVSLDILIALLQLMLSLCYRCLAKEMQNGPARQEVLAKYSLPNLKDQRLHQVLQG
jgi:hypothetical protein